MAEWNDKYRDGIRRFWAGEPGLRGDLAGWLMGSPAIFDRRHRRPWASINYLAAHDGFTAQDVVSYNEKHNEANGDENQDGHGENYSNNWGEEGPTEDADLIALRERVLRSMLATVFLSNGTPMLLAGDEFGNSQGGNNNAYCQDNEISWLDWKQAESPEGRRLTAFVARVAALRRSHPSLRLPRYLDGELEVFPGVSRVSWYDLDGVAMSDTAWEFAEGRVLGLRRATALPNGEADMSLMMVNAGMEDIEFQLPEHDFPWTFELDTANPEAEAGPVAEASVTVCAHGMVLLTSSLKPRQGNVDQ
jgi:glycogen operon protein